MEEETWKPITSCDEGYEVSNKGRIRVISRRTWCGRKILSTPFMLKLRTNFKGYKTICVPVNKKGKQRKVHRLVAEAFIPNPNNYPCINHKDEDKSNNNVENLEWCTYKYNSNYGTGKYRRIKNLCKPVDKLDLDGNYICTYPSIQEAARSITTRRRGGTEPPFWNIRNVCVGISRTAFGNKWRFSRNNNKDYDTK